MNSNTNPPLNVLISALLLSFIILSVLFNLQSLGLRQPDIFSLDRFDALSDQAPVIVALGTSKTRSGIYPDREMAAQLRAAGIEANFIRITQSGAVFDKIKPALEFLSNNPPDLLLLEIELISYSSISRSNLHPWRIRLNQNVDIINAITGLGSIDKEDQLQPSRYTADYCLDKKTKQSLEKYKKHAAQRRASSVEEQQAYLEYLDLMMSKGTDIILLDIPRSPTANKVFPATLRTEAKQLQRRLALNKGMQLWSVPSDSLPETAYCDQGHLSTTGQATLSRWIAERIASQELYDKVHHSG